MGSSKKIEKYVTQSELATFLRDLADAVENGGKDDLACVDDFQKMKIAIKHEFGQISLKAKIKPACVEVDPGDTTEDGTSPMPKYKHLKKHMKYTFKMLVKMIHDGQTPPREAVESFLSDSELMVSYPGYGDEYYASYTAACEAFREAFEAEDMERMHETIDVLVHEKSRCHAKYD